MIKRMKVDSFFFLLSFSSSLSESPNYPIQRCCKLVIEDGGPLLKIGEYRGNQEKEEVKIGKRVIEEGRIRER